MLRRAILDQFEVLGQLDEGELLSEVLVLGEIRHALLYVCARVDDNDIPVDSSEYGLEVEEHWEYLRFKDQLVAAVFAHGDFFGPVLVRHPERLDSALLLRITQDLGGVLCCHYFEKLVVIVNLVVVVLLGGHEFLECIFFHLRHFLVVRVFFFT